MKRVTITDVARRAGVSTGTVSRVLADHPQISAATKQRIREICEEMGYVPNMAARSLVKQSSQTLGLIIPDVSNPYFAEITLEIEIVARSMGYHLLICNSTRMEKREYEAAEQMLHQQVDGVIIAPASAGSMERLRTLYGNLPVVYLGDNHGGDCSYVTVDNVRGGYLGGQYLAELGHRNAVFIGGRAGSLTNRYRARGFLQAMEEYGFHGTVVNCPDEMSDTDRYDRLAREFLEKKPSITAVFAYSDRFAFSVMKAASELGYRIPEDLSLLGFNNISFAALPHINLTSIAHHNQLLGRTAVERLIAQIHGEKDLTQDILEPELIVRGSCRKVSSV